MLLENLEITVVFLDRLRYVRVCRHCEGGGGGFGRRGEGVGGGRGWRAD